MDAAYRMGFKKEMNVRAGISLKGMNDYTDWIVITEALVEAGFDDGEIKGLLGVNFLRLPEKGGFRQGMMGIHAKQLRNT